jgi:hypothetical protein
LSRAERWPAVALAVALGGCMRIYPDPELPDVKVEWFPDGECEAASDRVVVSLTTGDPAAEVATITAPCSDAGVRIVDVARERYQVSARLEDEIGAVLSRYEQDIDLRDGLNERVSLFFNRGFDAIVEASWQFDPGASCASLGATRVELGFGLPGEAPVFAIGDACELGGLAQPIQLQGDFVVTALAIAGDAVVAASPESAPFSLVPGELVELGVLVLSPCGDMCPQRLEP